VEDLSWLAMARHGESTGNVARARAVAAGAEVIDIPQRDADVPLTDAGRAQAAALGTWLAGLDRPPTAVVVSPYLRTTETARIALDTAGLRLPVRTDERLRDRELGVLDRLTGQGIRARYPEEAARKRHLGKFYYRPPAGESWADVALRLRGLRADLRQEYAGGRVFAVAHDAVIVLMRYVIEGLDEVELLKVERKLVGNASVTTWEDDGGGLRLTMFNNVDHLQVRQT
jgi:broad specificity phosphatase PhoE